MSKKSIKRVIERVRGWYSSVPPNVMQNTLTALLILGTGSAAYGFGMLSKIEAAKVPVEVVNADGSAATTTPFMAPKTGKAGHVADLLSDEHTSDEVVPTPKPKPTIKPVVTPAPTPDDGKVIGVKSSKHYYYPWCGTLSRVKESSVVVFNSMAIARAAGYTPAKNCKGLK